MAGGFKNLGNDSFDITELASLNDDISDELLDKLEHDISAKMGITIKDDEDSVNENDDSTLFEETQKTAENTEKTEKTEDAEKPAETVSNDQSTNKVENVTPGAASEAENPNSGEKPAKVDVVQNFDDNFIKKYKAKLKNRAQGGGDKSDAPSYGGVAPDGEAEGAQPDAEGDISELSQGNISERALSKDQKKYNDSLDFLDRNVKYSKYVIYIDPQNVNFIESLTVKERKNLINGILRQQDDISVTKLRFKVIQMIIRHVIIIVLTLAISIPVVYHVINASLEATINNHRSAQTNWQTLYKEHGKITQN